MQGVELRFGQPFFSVAQTYTSEIFHRIFVYCRANTLPHLNRIAPTNDVIRNNMPEILSSISDPQKSPITKNRADIKANKISVFMLRYLLTIQAIPVQI